MCRQRFGVVECVKVLVWGVAWGVESFPVVSVVMAELFDSVVELCLEVRYVRSVDDVLWKQVVDEDESKK